jgi:hypothetical protein
MVKYLLSLLMVFLGSSLLVQAQETYSYDFKSYPTKQNAKIKSSVGSDYYFVGFGIKGIKNDLQKKALERYFNANPNFKEVHINSVNEFHGYVKKTMHAKDVRPLLLSQGVDFKFDRYKFKGCYFKVAHQQQLMNDK